MFLDYIEIGTSDFDTEIQKNDNRIGISVEAVNEYVIRLPEKHGCIKLNRAVSNYNGNIKINYLSRDIIKKYNLNRYVNGCNSVNMYHPTITKLLAQRGIDIKDVATTDDVQCNTLIHIMNEYDVSGLYLLKVDTEGHDCIILNHFFLHNKDINLLPHYIIFESNCLTKKEDTENLIILLKDIGYDLISSGLDTYMRLNIGNVNKSFIFSNPIISYYIGSYPRGYDPLNLPHGNTLEEAQKYCIENKHSGVTYKNDRYEVRCGKYLEYHKSQKLISWLLF